MTALSPETDMSDSEPSYYAKLVTIRDVLVGARRRHVDTIYNSLMGSTDLANADLDTDLLADIRSISAKIAIVDQVMADEQQKVVL